MDEIKRCPFCGSEATWQQDGKWKYLECENPQCCASTAYDLGESGAAERWNTRPREDELERQLNAEVVISGMQRDTIDAMRNAMRDLLEQIKDFDSGDISTNVWELNLTRYRMAVKRARELTGGDE